MTSKKKSVLTTRVCATVYIAKSTNSLAIKYRGSYYGFMLSLHPKSAWRDLAQYVVTYVEEVLSYDEERPGLKYTGTKFYFSVPREAVPALQETK